MSTLVAIIKGLVWDKAKYQSKKKEYNIASGLAKKVDMGDSFEAVHNMIAACEKGKKGIFDLYEPVSSLESNLEKYIVAATKAGVDAKYIKSLNDQLALVKLRAADIRVIAAQARSFEASLIALKEEYFELKAICEVFYVHDEKAAKKRPKRAEASLDHLNQINKSNRNAIKALLAALNTPEVLKIAAFDPKKTKVAWDKISLEDLLKGVAQLEVDGTEYTAFDKVIAKATKKCGFWKTAESFGKAVAAMSSLDNGAAALARSFSNYSSFLGDMDTKRYISEQEFGPLETEIGKAENLAQVAKAAIPKATKIPPPKDD